MALTYISHEKLFLKSHPQFNEAWLHDRICDDPAMLGLGDVRVLDRERIVGSGRLDLLLFDEDNNRRFELEIMLGAMDPSHIIRTIEYWDKERRLYPSYEHVAVLVAEDVTARFLNVISLFSGSIPLVVIQLNALRIGENVVLSFITILDQTELRGDDTDDDTGGGATDRNYWMQKAGPALMQVCDQAIALVNEVAQTQQELNYLRGYIGLRGNGVVKNFVWFSPKRTKNFVHVGFLNPRSSEWKERLEGAGIQIHSAQKRRLRLKLSAEDFTNHKEILREVIVDTVREHED